MILSLRLALLLFLFLGVIHTRGSAQTLWEAGKVVVKLKTMPNGEKRNIRNAEFRHQLKALGVIETRQLFPRTTSTIRRTRYQLDQLYELSIQHNTVEQVLEMLAAADWVEYAEPSYIYFPLEDIPNDEHAALHWGHSVSKVYEAWDYTMGSHEVVVAVVDAGFRMQHPDLSEQFYVNQGEINATPGVDDDQNGYIDDVYGYDFGDFDADVEETRHQHGMQVAGIIAAKVNNQVGVFGVAPFCKIMPLKVARSSDGAYVNTFEAVKYAADNGADVINLSWGRQGFPSRYEQEIVDYCVNEKNVVFVGAAGNTASHGAYYPASYENVLSVTYSNASDERFGSSTNNELVDIMAPGVGIPTTQGASGYRLSITGSSYAAPFVAGGVALLKSKFPELSGKQIAELIRVTADDVYAVAANQNYRDLLGKGRLNMLRAMTEKDSTPALRLTGYAIQSSLRSRLVPGETISLTASFTNYLAPTQNARVILTTNSPYITIENGEVVLGSVGTLQESKATFTVKVAPNVPVNEKFPLRFGFVDGAYTDYHFLVLPLRPDPLVFKFNRMGLGMDSDGRIGITGVPNDPRGPGFYFDGGSNPLGNPQRAGINIMNASGLVIAASPERVSDAIAGDTPEVLNDDFTAIPRLELSGMQLHEYEGNRLSVKGSFEDYSANPNPVGLDIDQTIWGYASTEDLNYIIVQYDITNVSGATLPECYFTLFADWNLPDLTPEKAGWDAALNMGYLYQEGGGYIGIKILNAQPIHQVINMEQASAGGVDITDGFTDAEKYTVVSQGVTADFAEEGNLAHIVGADLSPFYKGNSTTVAMVILYANSLEELQTIARRSEVFTQEIPVNVITSLDNNKEQQHLQVWPNPASESIRIAFPQATSKDTEVALWQPDGKLVDKWKLREGITQHTIALPSLPSGMYLLKVTTTEGVVTQSVWVQ